jgi:hypothetical protein
MTARCRVTSASVVNFRYRANREFGPGLTSRPSSSVSAAP